MFNRALVVVALCLSFVSHAQDQWMPAPMPPPSPLAPVNANAAPLATDPIKFGIQFHGDFQGLVSGAGTTSLGIGASVGIGLNRVAVLLTPGITIAGSLSAVSLGLSVRIYLKNRQQGALVGFLRPSAQLGFIGSSSGFGSSSVLYGGLGFGGGGEYLLTRNLGITAELGLVFSSLGPSFGSPTTGLAALTTVGSVGVMLHQ